jgi:hypothetical protein
MLNHFATMNTCMLAYCNPDFYACHNLNLSMLGDWWGGGKHLVNHTLAGLSRCRAALTHSARRASWSPANVVSFAYVCSTPEPALSAPTSRSAGVWMHPAGGGGSMAEGKLQGHQMRKRAGSPGAVVAPRRARRWQYSSCVASAVATSCA